MRDHGRAIRKWFFWLPLLVKTLGKLLTLIGRPFKFMTRRLARIWLAGTHFQRNVLIGVLIALAIHLGHGTSWVQGPEDAAVDMMNRLHVDHPRLAGPPASAGYTLVDMDEEAYTAWGEPFHVPRDKLLELIRFAVDGEAAVIVVDVDLSTPGVDAEADRSLRDYLANYPAEAPDLVLMRTTAPRARGQQGLAMYRPVYFEKDIDSPAIHWAHPQFSKDLKDWRIRRWRLLEAGCFAGTPQWLPSPQLLAVLLTTEGRQGWSRLADSLQPSLPEDCEGKVELSHDAAAGFTLGKHEIDLAAHGVPQRILYAFSGAQALGIPELNYSRIPALPITHSDQPLSTQAVKGRFVVIGASYAASRDHHATPVGEMAGSLVILNAIKSLGQFGQLSGPPTWIKLLIEALLIGLMAWLFARFSSLTSVILTGLALMVVLVPISVFVFRYGIWVDLAAPVLGMQLHQIVADWEHEIEMKMRLANQQPDQ